MDSYIICSTPRTGSTLLCNLLASTGAAGDPDSFFMRDPDPVWAKRWGLPDRAGFDERGFAAACLDTARMAGRGNTPVFGLRLMQDSLADLCVLIGAVHPGLPSDAARLRAAFGQVLYIHLSRTDPVAQAVSMVRAEQTGLWHAAPDGTELERLGPPQDAEYDFPRIEAVLARLERQDAAWRTWFAEQGIVPHEIRYESLAADPEGTVAGIFRALCRPCPDLDGLRPGVARLSDATSRVWIERFRAEARAGRQGATGPSAPRRNP